ncbi:MAG TPA: exosortase system-associated protein, TIGR04073 family [bacterium]
MHTRKMIGVGLVVFAFLALQQPVAARSGSANAEDAYSKLGRGAINLVTGWVEIPMHITRTSRGSGVLTGWTWGLLKGVGYGFVRTVAGAYEIITFPFPAPPDYQPVIQPEYVFDEEPYPGQSGTYK